MGRKGRRPSKLGSVKVVPCPAQAPLWGWGSTRAPVPLVGLSSQAQEARAPSLSLAAEKRGPFKAPPWWAAQAPVSLTGLSISSQLWPLEVDGPRATSGLPCNDSGLVPVFAHVPVEWLLPPSHPPPKWPFPPLPCITCLPPSLPSSEFFSGRFAGPKPWEMPTHGKRTSLSSLKTPEVGSRAEKKKGGC